MGRLVNIDAADIFSNNLNLCTSIKIKLLRNNILRADNIIPILDSSDFYKNGYFQYKIIEEQLTHSFYIYLYPKEENDNTIFTIVNNCIGNLISSYGYGDLDDQELRYLSNVSNFGFLFTCSKISKGTYLINI